MTSIVLEDIEEDILIILEGKSLLKFEVRKLNRKLEIQYWANKSTDSALISLGCVFARKMLYIYRHAPKSTIVNQLKSSELFSFFFEIFLVFPTALFMQIVPSEFFQSSFGSVN